MPNECICGIKRLTVESVPVDAVAPARLRCGDDGAMDEVGVVEAVHAVRVVVVRRGRGRRRQQRGVRGRRRRGRVLPLHEAAVKVHLADSKSGRIYLR